MTLHRRIVLLGSLTGIIPASADLAADDSPAAPDPMQSIRYVTAILLDHLPPKFEGDKDWGRTGEVWSGVKVRWKDGRLRTHRRTKSVDHGRWVAYQIELPAGGLRLDDSVHIRAVGPSSAGESPGGGHRLDVRVTTPIRFTVRVQRHVRGVRLASVTVTGRAKITLDASATIDSYTDITEVPPAMVIDPSVQSARLSLDRFEVDRISHLGGDVAEAWGEIAQETIVDLAIRKTNDKLTDQLNRAIDRHRDDLRVSPRDWMRRWLAGKP